MSSGLFELTKGVWTKITTSEKSGKVLHITGAPSVVYIESPVAPVGYDENTPTTKTSGIRESFLFGAMLEYDFLWAYAINGDATISVTPTASLTEISLKSDDTKQALYTEFGELTVGMRIDDVSVNFHYGISTRDTKDESTGTGSVINVGSDMAVCSGLGVGTGELVSIDAVRYRAGHESITMITHDQTVLEAGVDVQHGLLNTADGLAIGSEGTVKGAWFIEGGNENFIPHTDFNEDTLDGNGRSGFDWDPTMRNLFMITFGYLSIAPIRYYIKTAKGWVLFHTIALLNTQAVGHLKNPTLPVACRVRRVTGSGSDVQVKSGSWRAGTVGPERQINAADRWFSFTASKVNLGSIDTGANPNLYHNIFTLDSADIFNSKPNHIRAEVAVVSFVVDANKTVEFVSQIDAVLVGNDPFVDIDASNSIMSASVGGTSEGQTAGAATVLGKTSDRRTSVRGTGIFIRAGQKLTLGARGIDGASVTGDISGSFRWVEEF